MRGSLGGAKQRQGISLHSLQSLEKMLPGLENTFCTQLQADNAAVHQAECAREGEGVGGMRGRKRGERRTEGPRGAETL